MTKELIQEERLQADLKRWAEAGSPSFDLGGALQRRQRQARNRWRRWGSIAATLLVLSTSATLTFPAWAATAANWPLIGEPIKAYLAERAGLSWAYEMGFYQANLAELSDGTVTLRVLGVLADPIQTKVFYQITGLEPQGGPNSKPIPAGTDAPPPPEPAELQITGIDGQGGVSSYFPIDGFNTTDSHYIAETSPITGETATLNLRLRVGDLVKEVDVPVSVADSRRFFKQIPLAESQGHGSASITLQSITLSPAEVVLSYQTETPPGPKGGWTSRGFLAQPYLRSGGRELEGRPITGFGLNGISHVGFERVKGEAQLVIPAVTAPTEINARWDWAPGATATVQGIPVTLTAIHPTVGGGSLVDWTYPADAPLLGFGGYTLIAADGTRLPLDDIGSGGGTEAQTAHATVSLELPAGFRPAAIEVSHAVMRVDGPWVFDLPPLPAKP